MCIMANRKPMDNQKTARAWWTLDDVVKVVFANKLSKTTLYNLARSGKVPATRFGHRWSTPNSWVQYQIHQGNAISFTDPEMYEFMNGND